MAKRNVPAVAYAIIEAGEIKELKVIGELEKGVPAPAGAIFNIASVTKPVFALTVLKLVESGALNLDEPLHPYWIDPDIKDGPRHKLLTARIILSHQTGFPNWRWNKEDRKLSFGFDPGTQYQYSGEGYEYLKMAIQNKLQKGLVQLVDSLIFDPLEMSDSRLIWDKQMDESRFAKWHNKEGGLYQINKRKDAVASDDLMTTLDDYCRFALHIIEKGGLSEELYQEMVSPQVAVTKNSAFALGWELAPNLPGGEYALVHGGSDMGVRARAVILPKSKRAFIIFTNGDKGQRIIDRQMVKRFDPGKAILKKIYHPIMWRIIYLPF